MTTPWRVRRGGEADIGDWAAMRSALWPDSTPQAHAEEIRGILARSDESPAAFLAIDADGNARGFAEAALRYDYVNGTDSSPVGFLEGWYVAPACAGAAPAAPWSMRSSSGHAAGGAASSPPTRCSTTSPATARIAPADSGKPNAWCTSASGWPAERGR